MCHHFQQTGRGESRKSTHSILVCRTPSFCTLRHKPCRKTSQKNRMQRCCPDHALELQLREPLKSMQILASTVMHETDKLASVDESQWELQVHNQVSLRSDPTFPACLRSTGVCMDKSRSQSLDLLHISAHRCVSVTFDLADHHFAPSTAPTPPSIDPLYSDESGHRSDHLSPMNPF